MISVKNLSLTLEEKEVFSGISFDVSAESFFLIKGRSGSGKSLILQALAGMIPEVVKGEVSGSVSIRDKNPVEEGVVGMSGDVGYMMQDADSQLCTFSVKDEILFGMENLNLPKEEMTTRMNDVLRLFQIEDLRHRSISELSGGQKQKVCFAALYTMNPQVFLLDEPTANLDPDSAREIISIAKMLVREEGKTVLIVEHNHGYIKDDVDGLYDLDNRRLVTDGVAEYIESYIHNYELPPIDFPPGEKVILSGKNISFSYGDLNVLKDISLELREGEILAIAGKSGSGKSTLANLLSGLVRAPAKTIQIDGKDLSKLNTMAMGETVGLVFQNPEHQFIKYTVWDELALGLVTRHYDSDAITEHVEASLAAFRLAEKKDANPYELSQGEKRKLSTASMLITGQKVLILDEPTYGQDRENLIHLLELLYKVAREKVGIILISHDPELVTRCCHRALWMTDGRLVPYERGEAHG